MNGDQIGGIVRAIAGPLVTYLVAKNIIPVGSADVVIAAFLAVSTAVWSVFSNKSGKTIS